MEDGLVVEAHWHWVGPVPIELEEGGTPLVQTAVVWGSQAYEHALFPGDRPLAEDTDTLHQANILGDQISRSRFMQFHFFPN